MNLIGPATMAIVVRPVEPAEATMVAVYSYRHLFPFHHRPQEVIGTVGYDPNDDHSQARLMRFDNMLHARYGWQSICRDNVKTAVHHERRALSDLERFRRKMLKVVRQYNNNRQLLMAGAGGLFQDDRLRELDAELDRAWTLMEDRYGCKREQLDDPALAARARELESAGKLFKGDPFEQDLS